MTDPDDLLDPDAVAHVAAKWGIPHREARRMLRRLAANKRLGVSSDEH